MVQCECTKSGSDSDISVCTIVPAGTVYISAVFQNGAVQLLRHEIYRCQKVCGTAKLCGRFHTR